MGLPSCLPIKPPGNSGRFSFQKNQSSTHNELPPRTRNIKSFLLNYLSGYSNSESAQAFGCLASGYAAKLHCFIGGEVRALHEGKVEFFQYLVDNLFGPSAFSFAECKQQECREYRNAGATDTSHQIISRLICEFNLHFGIDFITSFQMQILMSLK